MQRRGEFDLRGVYRQFQLYSYRFIFRLGDKWYADVCYIIPNIFLCAWSIVLIFKPEKIDSDILLFESQVA